MSSDHRGRVSKLRLSPLGADTRGIESKRTSPEQHGRRGARELGQAMVEFALVAPVFLLIVVGIIQFGIALNYWLDLQKLSGQGARWAAVNRVPGCADTTQLCTSPYTLQGYVAAQKVSGDQTPGVCVQFPSNSGVGSPPPPAVGDPVTVRVAIPFKLLPVLKVGTLHLKATATMRMEQLPQAYAPGFGGTPARGDTC